MHIKHCIMLFIGLLMNISYKLVTFYCTSEERICFETLNCDLIERFMFLSISEPQISAQM